MFNASFLWIMFNCLGPLEEHGAKLPMKGVYALKQPADAGYSVPYYFGRDGAARPAKPVPWWELRMVEGEFLWCLLVYALEALCRGVLYV